MLAVDTGGIQTVFKHYTALRLALGMSESSAKSDSRRFFGCLVFGCETFRVRDCHLFGRPLLLFPAFLGSLAFVFIDNKN